MLVHGDATVLAGVEVAAELAGAAGVSGMLPAIGSAGLETLAMLAAVTTSRRTK